jgi:ATP-binding cassette subfamily F protein 3
MARIPILTVDHLTKSYGATDIFAQVTFQIAEREHVALVGVNGAGKSTLLRIIAGQEEANGGTVVALPGTRVTYLPQEAQFESDRTIREEALAAFAPVLATADRMREIEARMATANDATLEALLDEYDQLQLRFEAASGYDVEHRTDEVLHGLGFSTDQFSERIAFLSGGQKTRLALAKALLAEPDLLLLDEPTNHLDLEMLEWLEGFLRTWTGACLIVSHDRYFLDRVTTRTLELSFGRLEDYPAPYSRYVELRAQRQARRLQEYEEQQEFVQRTEEFIRKYKAGQRAREAKGRQTRLDRLERLERPQEHETFSIKMPPSVRSGQIVMTINKLTAGYAGENLERGVADPFVAAGQGPSVLDLMLGRTGPDNHVPNDGRAMSDFPPGASDEPTKVLVKTGDLVIERGDRVALVGPNGSGKTTLLRTLVGIIPPLQGRYQYGANVKLGYYAQTHEQLPPDETPLSVILDAQPMSEESARTYLGRFLFTADDVFKQVSALSGGERSRLALAVLLLQQANFLVLDEPTNHLDILARETLEQMLHDFDGTVLFVSHDRYFIDKIATRVWAIEDGTVKTYLGNYSDYQRQLGRQLEPAKSGDPSRSGATIPSVTRSVESREPKAPVGRQGASSVAVTAQPALSGAPTPDGTAPNGQPTKVLDNRTVRQLQRQLQQVEQTISKLEAKLNDVSDAMAVAGAEGDTDALARLGTEYERSHHELDQAYARWEEINTQLEPALVD